MSLCRWSDSPFYIYEECGSDNDEIKVQFLGYFKSKEILCNPFKIFKIGKNDSGILSGIELLIWLYPWAMMKEDLIKNITYSKILTITRFLSYTRTYCKDNESNNFRSIVSDVDRFFNFLAKKIVNDPIHKLPWEEKRKIFKEEGYL